VKRSFQVGGLIIEQQTYQARLQCFRHLREFPRMNRVNKSWALDKSDKLRKGCSPLIFKVTEGFERSSVRPRWPALRNSYWRGKFDDL